MVIEEKDLSGIGGWDCYKKAKTYLAAGSVLKSSSSVLEDGSGVILFTGHVLEGKKKYVCGLKFRTLDDVDNLCRCKRAINAGSICEHSMAVVLDSIKREEKFNQQTTQVAESEDNGDILYEDNLIPVFKFSLNKIPEIESFLLTFESSGPDQRLRPAQISNLKELLGNVEPVQGLEVKCNKDQFGKVLEVMRGGGLFFKSNGTEALKRLVISETEVRLPLSVIRSGSDDSSVQLSRIPLEAHHFIYLGSVLWILNERHKIIMPIAKGSPSKKLLDRFLTRPAEEASVLVSLDWLRCNSAQMNKLFHMECSDDLIKTLRLLPANPNLKLIIEGSLRNIEIIAEFIYQENDVLNDSLEREQLKSLRAINSQQTSHAESYDENESQKVNAYKWRISGEDNVFSFYAGELDKIIRSGQADVIIGERFYRVTKDIEKVRPNVKVREDGDKFFDFELEFIGDRGTRIPEKEMRLILERGKSMANSSSGAQLAINNESVAKLFEGFEICSIDQSLISGTVRRRVELAETFYAELLLKDFANFEIQTKSQILSPPKYGFSAKLREYQSQGLSWMNRRLSKGCGLILADEMGLGKTVQTLALISSAKCLDGPALIICPTSLIDNWHREIEKFTNKCKILIIHGPDRASKFRKIPDSDVVISSYSTVVKDSESYKEINFSLIVADESSYLKNPDTKTFKALSDLNGYAKMALSGTPLENKLLDLWSVMELVNPSYLGSRKEFMMRYSGTISKSDQSCLRRRVAPFVLRRTKKMVLSEIPAKTERVIHCSLTPEQRMTYDGILRAGKEQLLSFNSNSDEQSSRIEVLSILLRLRQVCCDVNLVQPVHKQIENDSSGKIDPMMSIVRSSASSGGKVLIFSQFVKMLRLIDNVLSENNIDFYSLDGSTPRVKRDSQVQAFQNDSAGPSVFLISLKAGGYGLNLTAADKIIHFDPWWNPSVENQATDRAHRIGQTKPVTSYKLIAAGTVEERILKLQEHKKGLIDVLNSDADPMMDGLTDDDIRAILL